MGTLTNPYIGYLTIEDALAALLKANFATLNLSLTTGLTFTKSSQILDETEPDIVPKFKGLYPLVFIYLGSRDEEFTSLGADGTKDPVVRFFIIPAVKLRKDPRDVRREVIQLTDNIEGLLRQNIDISNTVLYSNPSSGDWRGAEQERGIYVYASTITLDCTIRIE